MYSLIMPVVHHIQLSKFISPSWATGSAMLAENGPFRCGHIFLSVSADERLFVIFSANTDRCLSHAFAPVNIVAVLNSVGSVVQITAHYLHVNWCATAILAAVAQTAQKCIGSHGENILKG